MDESRKRIIGIMAAILATLHTRADDLFRTPQGSPRTDMLILSFDSMGRENHAEN
ncbi:MAG: hypothetical protein JWN92_1496 [Candidatus Acidoferrum typicum]|nr:hypothetical protein [Candidatus Acidoferrum typicum]